MVERGLDIVVVVRVAAKKIGYFEMESALLHLLSLHNRLICSSEEDADN